MSRYPRGTSGQITKEARLTTTPLLAPIAAGQVLGEYTVHVGNDVVARVPLVALAARGQGRHPGAGASTP